MNNLLEQIKNDKLTYPQRLRIETIYHDLFETKSWESQSSLWVATIQLWLTYEGYDIVKKENNE